VKEETTTTAKTVALETIVEHLKKTSSEPISASSKDSPLKQYHKTFTNPNPEMLDQEVQDWLRQIKAESWDIKTEKNPHSTMGMMKIVSAKSKKKLDDIDI
jgi:hypothetical protein